MAARVTAFNGIKVNTVVAVVLSGLDGNSALNKERRTTLKAFLSE